MGEIRSQSLAQAIDTEEYADRDLGNGSLKELERDDRSNQAVGKRLEGGKHSYSY